MKIKNWLSNQFTFSIQEISFAGIFTALWIISSKFIVIDFGIMKAGIIYVWAILLGLTTKPVLGVVTAIIADTISTAIGIGLGGWMWEYAIIYPLIVVFTSLFKHAFKIKNKYVWWLLVAIINTIAIIGALVIAIYKNDFVSSSRNADTALDFTKTTTKVAIWVCMGIMFIFFTVLVVMVIKDNKYKNYLTIYSLVAATIVLFIWVWGPISQIRYLQRLNATKDYWAAYDTYLFGRVLKTPVILPLYTIIITSVYIAYNQIQTHTKHSKW